MTKSAVQCGYVRVPGGCQCACKPSLCASAGTFHIFLMRAHPRVRMRAHMHGRTYPHKPHWRTGAICRRTGNRTGASRARTTVFSFEVLKKMGVVA